MSIVWHILHPLCTYLRRLQIAFPLFILCLLANSKSYNMSCNYFQYILYYSYVNILFKPSLQSCNSRGLFLYCNIFLYIIQVYCAISFSISSFSLGWIIPFLANLFNNHFTPLPLKYVLEVFIWNSPLSTGTVLTMK